MNCGDKKCSEIFVPILCKQKENEITFEYDSTQIM